MYRTTSIFDEIRESFRKGNALTKLIYINLGVFLVVQLFFIVFFLFNSGFVSLAQKSDYFQSTYLSFFMVPSELNLLVQRPWTVLTYMFLHFGFLHILFNLLVLFWFGRIFLHYLSERQLVTTYLLGGLAGAAMFILAYNVFPGLSQGEALGASAAIMAIVIAISVFTPDYTVYIPIVGPTKLKYLALVYVVLDVLQIASDNAGGHLAHLGGAIYGYSFAMRLRHGKDLGHGLGTFRGNFLNLFKRKSKLKVSYKSQAKTMNDFDYNKSKVETQKEIDRILDKIAKGGYDSLTKSEKETLFKVSNKS
jgi:membrane associated rhomboid family serine protease